MWTNENSGKLIAGTIGTLVSFAGYQISLDEINQIVSIVCSILGILITFIGVVIVPFVKKLKEAKSDGKITIDEVEDIVEDTKKNLDDFKGDK